MDAGETAMPTPAYVTITGETQGDITAGAFTADSVGNVYQLGHEDEILVQEIKHEVITPTDPQSGQPSGPRVHKPLTFSSSLNKATPLMYQALANGEMLPTVEFKWYRTSMAGKQEHFFTTKLLDATIVRINTVLPHAQDKKNENYTQLIEVSLAYRMIIWEHGIAGTMGSDDWRAPNV
jgi:type VI secretion system secreted protein Hcp